METLQTRIKEKKKKVIRPEILNQAYVDLIYPEIETLQCCSRDI
jgi:hypothetical protein